VGDVADILFQDAGRHKDQVVEGGPAQAGRLPRPVVVIGVEVLDRGDLQTVRGAGRWLEAVQRGGRCARGGAGALAPASLSADDHHVSAL
jgi:hypothetical protein